MGWVQQTFVLSEIEALELDRLEVNVSGVHTRLAPNVGSSTVVGPDE